MEKWNFFMGRIGVYHNRRKECVVRCNILIQPHFDFACCACYSNLPESLKSKSQSTQIACRRFRHIVPNDFEKNKTAAYNLEKTSLLYISSKVRRISKSIKRVLNK